MLDKRKTNYFFNSDKARERFREYLENSGCYPSDVVLHLNTVCNHRCDFCYNFLNLNNRNHYSLDSDYVVKLLSEFSGLSIDKVIVSGGGEPLLYKDIKKVLSCATSFDFHSFLYTNLDHDIDEVLMNTFKKIDGINVNINTTDSETYKRTRGEAANLVRVLENIKVISEESIDTIATIIIRDNTINTLENTIYSLVDLGIGRINISPAFNLHYKDKVRIGNKTLNELERVRDKIKNKKIKVLEPEEKSVIDSDGNIFCEIHYFDITIGADYGIYPCCAVSYLDKYKMLDLRDYESFEDAWHSKVRENWIREFNPTCSNCWFAPVNKIIKENEEKWKK